MYLCCGRNNSILGRANTEKEAQEMCTTLGSSYIKIIPILFWFMRNSNKYYTFSTTKGFLSYEEIMNQIRCRYNKVKNVGLEELVSIYEEFFGDCSDLLLKKVQSISY